jgi:regulator of sigma E protease
MEIGWNIVWAIIAISLLVTVHEFGHYWVARKLGFKVLRFSVGFGKPLYKRIGRAPDHIEYVIAAIPLGGYVRMADAREGDVAPEDRPRAFGSRPPWARILVLLAGPAANFLFAIVVLWLMFWVRGEMQIKPVVGDVVVNSIAANAGLRSGDVILEINGDAVHDQLDAAVGLLDSVSDDGIATLRVQPRDGAERTVNIAIADKEARFKLTEPNKLFTGLGFEFWRPVQPPVFYGIIKGGPADLAGFKPGDTAIAVDGKPLSKWSEFASYVSTHPGVEIALTVKRGTEEVTHRVTPRVERVDGKTLGKLDVDGTLPKNMDFESLIPAEYKTRAHYGPMQAFGAGVVEAWDMTVIQAKFFWRMITLKVSTKNLSSVITIAEYAGETARAGFTHFLMLLVMLSLTLGFLNLLPIPILDGGQIVFQAAEWIRGRAMSDRAHLFAQQVGLVAIVLLMGMALFNDVTSHLGALGR